jgi:thiosulfate dehydrogenase
MSSRFLGSPKASISIFVAVILCMAAAMSCNNNISALKSGSLEAADTSIFTAPDTSTIPHDQFGDMVRYGRELVVNTAVYLGPDGKVGKYLGNKMNCSNCHMDGGTRPYGFNYFSSHARYPQYRGREDRVLTMGERINNCIERPHNGTALPLDSREIEAMASYIKWLGGNVPVGQHVKGDEAMELEYPTRAADIWKGAAIYAKECMSCHGADGQGVWRPDSATYIYPPLWGAQAYQNGSSPSRVLKLARFIKANMPDKKATWRKPYLTDEQAIDVAAFINDGRIHARPQKRERSTPDYPVLKMKPIDYETGPYGDTFSALQHKFGPYKPIIDYHKAHNLPVIF